MHLLLLVGACHLFDSGHIDTTCDDPAGCDVVPDTTLLWAASSCSTCAADDQGQLTSVLAYRHPDVAQSWTCTVIGQRAWRGPVTVDPVAARAWVADGTAVLSCDASRTPSAEANLVEGDIVDLVVAADTLLLATNVGLWALALEGEGDLVRLGNEPVVRLVRRDEGTAEVLVRAQDGGIDMLAYGEGGLDESGRIAGILDSEDPIGGGAAAIDGGLLVCDEQGLVQRLDLGAGTLEPVAELGERRFPFPQVVDCGATGDAADVIVVSATHGVVRLPAGLEPQILAPVAEEGGLFGGAVLPTSDEL